MGQRRVWVLRSGLPQLCSDNLLTLLLYLLLQEWQFLSRIPSLPPHHDAPPHQHLLLYFSLIAAGRLSSIQSLLELGWTGGGKDRWAFSSVSVTVPGDQTKISQF